MILSNTDISSEITKGSLRIANFNEDCMRPSSYLLRLNNHLLRLRDGEAEIDTKKTDTADYFDSYEIGNEGFILKPGDFYLGSSVEKLSIPLSMCADLFQLSCYARIGLSVNFSSNLVASSFGISEPSTLTFEIKNLSNRDIRIYPYVKFCHIRFLYHETQASQKYNGIYSGQSVAKASNFEQKPAR
ncbi:dCTP deaminase [Pseudoalteromonas sp. SSMSWG5]|uniref:dCTP deaminase n=1 Tax=Pseudoalteromonas sp. SSMSWG5 TaxID=3139396 RepID=UPI003BAA2798